MSMNELNATAQNLISVRAMIEELQAEAEALTDQLKGHMVEQGTEFLQGDGWRVTWRNVNSSLFHFCSGIGIDQRSFHLRVPKPLHNHFQRHSRHI